MSRLNNKAFNLAAVAFGLAALLVACGGEENEGGEQDGGRIGKVHSLAGGLERLGVDTSQSDRTDPEGNALPKGYNPLSKKYRTLAPLSELYFSGMTIDDKDQGLLDDGTESYAELYSDADGSWTQLHHISGKGDLDGDGFDEVVVAYHVANDKEIKLKVIDRGADGIYTATTSTLVSGVDVSAGHPALATGDLDHDGLDEIALAFAETLYIVDDAKAGLALLDSRDYSSPNPDKNVRLLSPGIGDFNGDGKAQLYLVHSLPGKSVSEGHANFYLYDSTDLTKEQDSGLLTFLAGDTAHVITLARIAVGDIDGDKLDEVVFNAASDKASGLVFALDDRKTGAALSASRSHTNTAAVLLNGVTLLDVDGDATKEIFNGTELLKYDANKDDLTVVSKLPSSILSFTAAGDVDGDHREDLVHVALMIPSTLGVLTIWGMDQTSTFVKKETKTATLSGNGVMPTLVTANVDDDSLVVRYTGKTELHFSKPQLIAVMAAPPYYQGIGQNVDGSGTTFGRSKALETEASASVGLSVGFSIGAKAGFKLFGNGVEVETKRTFKASMDWTATATASYETTVSYTGGPDEDKVVFTSVPFDVYYYEVVSSPDPNAVGETITINLPRAPQTFSVSRTFYNANNGDALDVDASILPHTIGDPRSYPTAAEMKAATHYGILPIGFVNPDTVTVGQGSGVQTMTINASASLGLGVEMELSVETEAEVTAGPVVAGGSVEFRLGVGLSVTASEGLFIEGVIGDIPEASYTGDMLYKAGIYAYPHKADGQFFLVINYWVE
jgi:hypothetical protein